MVPEGDAEETLTVGRGLLSDGQRCTRGITGQD